MEKLSNQNVYKTRDFLTASILFYYKHTLIVLDKSNPDKIVFSFDKGEKTDQLLNLFYQEKLLVEPRKLSDIQRNLKRRMFT